MHREEHKKDGSSHPARRMAAQDVAEAERDRLIHELHEAQDQVRLGLAAMARLHQLGSLFVCEGNLEPVLAEIVDAAIDFSGADFGNIQLLDPESSDLRIVAQRGFPDWWLEFWNTVSKGQGVCGTALERGERVIVEDVERSPIFAGTSALEVQRRAGVRSVQSTPLVSRSGKPLGMFSTHWRKPGRPELRALRFLDLLARHAADITERALNEQAIRLSEERLRVAQQVARVGTFELDIKSGVNAWTPELEAMYGVPRGGFPKTQAAWENLIHPDDRAEALRLVRHALENGVPAEGEWRVVWPDGSVHWIAARWRVLKDGSGKPLRMMGINVEITERKRAEEALRASEAVLREADRHKDRFLALLSHELRNPLAPIHNSLQILERAAPGGEQAKRAQATIQRQIGHLTWLIDDLLDVTRIANGKIQLKRERLDLNELAHRTVEDHRLVFAKSDVRLEVLPAVAEVWVEGDRVRLGQVISNLLQNAAKFTPHGGKATVIVEPNAAGTQARLIVRDTGDGITPEMLPRLFHAFSQTDDTRDRSKGGLGLGLSLVKGLVEMHGGSVSAASDGRGKGATFVIDLPLAGAAETSPSPSEGSGAAAPCRVLVIDDNEDSANTLREVLAFGEHVVEVAYTGRDGIEKARVFHPDVVLCDIGLPEMDGYSVARAMRADPELGRVGLVAVSGYAQPDDVTMAKEAGFDAHLAKPPSIDTLERALAAVGNLHQDVLGGHAL